MISAMKYITGEWPDDFLDSVIISVELKDVSISEPLV